MSNSLVVNSSNVIGSYNNTYQYKFIQGSFQSKDCEMAIGSATIPYSWYNTSPQAERLHTFKVNTVEY